MALAALASALAFAACVPVEKDSASQAALEDDRLTLGDSYLSQFYAYEGQLEMPGKLLRSETLDPHQANPGAAQNLRILYSSTDGIGGEDVLPVSGVLFLPRGNAPDGGWPLMAWTHGTVGIADVCAPSWNGRQQQDREHLQFWLDRGFAVAASDYQGLGTAGTHPYLATRPEAFSNLDLIRAVQRAEFPVSDRVVLFGQSQGAGAAVASAAYAGVYATELDIAGVVATGVPYFSPEALVALQESRPPDRPDPMLAYNLLALSLVQLTDPEFKLGDYVSDLAMPLARSVRDECHKQIRADVMKAGLTYNQTFRQAPSEHLRKAFSLMGYPTLALEAPLFVGTGMKDRDTPPRMQAALVKRACAAGTRVTAKAYPELDHRGVVPGSTKDTLPFVKAVFEGREIDSNCNDLPF